MSAQSSSSAARPLFDAIPDAVAAMRAGEFVVVLDDEDRENEGDLICAAELCTTEMMAWFVRHSR
jgi:3,4-dihydroxy 2-butanone 4-phosphate synthase